MAGASKGGSKLGGSLRTLGKVAAVGVGAAFAGLAATLKVGFDELGEAQKVMAQTGAVLESTGHAANVTAKQVEGLAGSLSRMSGVDDEAIQSGENLLLTFTNVRNEVGKGNDVFNQATKTMLDMSVALGTEASGSAIQLGKALNDPVKGITALTRVGVSFTEGQKATIKSLVDSGKTMAAQKIILAELNKEFGGSAKAVGDTLPGQLSKLKNAFEEAAARIAATLLPHLMDLLGWVNAHMPEIEAVITAIVGGIETAFQKIGDAVNLAKGPLGDFKKYLEDNPGKAKILAGAIGGVAVALGIATVAQLAFNFAVLLNPYVATVAAAAALTGALFALYATNVKVHKAVDDFYADLKRIAIPTLEVLHQAWVRFDKALGVIAKAIVVTVTVPFQNAYDIIVGTFRAFRALFTGDWRGLGTALLQIVDALGGNLVKAFGKQIQALYQTGFAIGKAALEGIKAGFAAAFESVKQSFVDKANQLKDALTHPWQIRSPSKVTIEIGKQIAEGLGVGFGQGMVTVTEKAAEKINAAIDAMIAAVQNRRGVLGEAFSALTSEALSAFDRMGDGMKTASEKALAAFDLKQAAAAAKKQIQDLKDAVTLAQSELAAVQGRGPESVTRSAGETDEAFHARQLEAEKQFLANVQAAQATAAGAALALQAEKDAQAAAAHRADLEKQAAKERKALDDRREVKRKHLDEELQALAAQAEKTGMSAEETNKRVLKILKKYGVPFKDQGALLGGAIAEGLREAIVDVSKAARSLAEAIKKQLEKLNFVISVNYEAGGNPAHRQHGGPVGKGRPYVVGEKGPELFVPGRSGAIIPNGGGSAAMAGGVVNHYHIAGSILAERDLIALVGKGVGTFKRNNGS